MKLAHVSLLVTIERCCCEWLKSANWPACCFPVTSSANVVATLSYCDIILACLLPNITLTPAKCMSDEVLKPYTYTVSKLFGLYFKSYSVFFTLELLGQCLVACCTYAEELLRGC